MSPDTQPASVDDRYAHGSDAANDSRIIACILTRNEARHIEACLTSVSWTHAQMVVDCGSTDATVDLARARGAIVLHRDWDGWAGQRTFAINEAFRRGYRWIFFVDADERVPPELSTEATRVVEASDAAHAAGDTTSPVGFWVPRRNIIAGKWVRHAGWDPDYQLRLFRTDRGRYDPARPVHELVLLDGPAAHLEARLVHYNYDDWQHFWIKQQRYARIEATARVSRGHRVRPHNFILQPWREFWRRYVTLEGWREFQTLRLAWAGEASANQGRGGGGSRFHTPRSHHHPAPPDLNVRSSQSPSQQSRGLPLPTLRSLARRIYRVAAPTKPSHVPDPLPSDLPDFGNDPPDTVAVVVSYNVAPLLHECLASIAGAAEAGGITVHVVVIDNASSDHSIEVARANRNTTVVANSRNVGFGVACNQGIAIARAIGSKHVLFLNPDARLAPAALAALRNALETSPRHAIAGPDLRFPDGRPQPSRRRFPNLATLLVESTPLQWRGGGLDGSPGWPLIEAIIRRYQCADLADVPGTVDWISGACLLIRVTALAAVGGFDPAFFLYFEETDLAHRLRKSGWTCTYAPEARVFHHRSQSADQNIGARDRHYYASKMTYAARTLGTPLATLVRAEHVVLFGVEALWQSFRGNFASLGSPKREHLGDGGNHLVDLRPNHALRSDGARVGKRTQVRRW
ncbi:MAG: glycosyltransferase [Chloroflexi bacterium]|nr:glycosyltransferase [Chloroflexota bacterium]